jgi:hypothetical protein
MGDEFKQYEKGPSENPMVQKQEPFRRATPKIGRNAVVRIRKGPETQDLKWKKAEALVRDEGWEVVETLSE